MIEIILPIYWQQSKKKRILLSMNQYRNMHYQTQCKFKNDLADMVSNQVTNTKNIAGRYIVIAKLYYERTNCDASNIVPLLEKAFLDSLVSLKLLEGDNVKYHVGTQWEVIGQDKVNPRCEIQVIGIDDGK